MSAAATAPVLEPVVARVDEILEGFLAARREEAVAIEPSTAEPIEEIVRLVHAGGKRLRPAFTYWGYRAAGGQDCPEIWRAAAAVELLHTMALLHDDVMDADDERRGAPTAHGRARPAPRGRASRPTRGGSGTRSRSSRATSPRRSPSSWSPRPGSLRTARRQVRRAWPGCGSSSRWAPTSRWRTSTSIPLRSPTSKVARTPWRDRCCSARPSRRTFPGRRGPACLRSAARHRLPALGRPRRRRRVPRRLAGPGRRPGCGVRGGARRPPAGPDRRRRARHARRAGGFPMTRAGGV